MLMARKTLFTTRPSDNNSSIYCNISSWLKFDKCLAYFETQIESVNVGESALD